MVLDAPEVMLTSTPVPSRCRTWRAKVRLPNRTPLTLTSTWWARAAVSASARKSIGSRTPALLTHSSIRPNRSMTMDPNRSRASASVTSAATVSASAPGGSVGRVRAQRPSRNPCSAKVEASPAPSPLLAPVTTATGVLTSTLGRIEDVLDLGVRTEGLEAQLPAEPRLLHPTEAGLDAHGAVGVDRQVPCLHRSGRAQALGPVPGPDGTRQPIGRVVGQPHRFVLAVEGDHRHDRPEDLLGRQPPVVLSRGHPRGREPKPGFVRE